MVGRTLLHEPKTNPLVAARWQGRTVVGGYHNAWSTLINNQHRNVRSKQLGSTNNQSHALPVGLTRSGQARVCSIPNFKRCGVCERFQHRIAEEVVGRTLLHEPKTNPWVKFRRGEDQPGWNGFCEQRLFPSLQNPFANLQVHVISV
jgi:hypothetical protein